jgi:hypothetical protein
MHELPIKTHPNENTKPLQLRESERKEKLSAMMITNENKKTSTD